jgi:transposase-like protein
MNRKPHSQNPPCPRCGATHVIQNGSQGGRPRWVCRNGGRSFGPTLGTAMDRWRATPTEVARTLLVVMRRGSLSAAEAITGHQVETIRRWRRAAARHAEALTEVLVHDRHLSEVEVDAFGSFVKKSVRRLEIRTPRRAGWARVGDVGVRTGPLVLGWRGALGLRRRRSRRRGWRRPARAHRAREEWLGSAMVGPSIVGRLAASTGTRNRRESGGVRPWRPRPGWGGFRPSSAVIGAGWCAWRCVRFWGRRWMAPIRCMRNDGTACCAIA